MKNTVLTALRSYQFNSEVESQRYFEALRLAVEVERDPGEPQGPMAPAFNKRTGAVDFAYIVSHFLVQPELQLLPYHQRDLWSGLGEETNRDALGFKLATLLAPVGSHWKHYNRPETYEVLAVARYYDRNEQFVVFCNANNPAEIWMRTVDDFFSRVRTPGSLNPPEVGDGWRFVRIDEVEGSTTTDEQFAAQLTELYVNSGDTIIREQQAMTRKLFSRYLKHIGSKARFISANSYRQGSIELVYEDDTSTPTSLWVQTDEGDPNPGQTILFLLSQAIERVQVIQTVLSRADLEVRTMRNTRQLAAVQPDSQQEIDELLKHIAEGYCKQLFATLGTVGVIFSKDHDTGAYALIIEVPVSDSNRALLGKFGAEEIDGFMSLRRTWGAPSKE